jgi:hypothetical protein
VRGTTMNARKISPAAAGRTHTQTKRFP